MLKRLLFLGLLLVMTTTLSAQRSIPFSTEEYFGGGVGYAPTFLLFDIAAGFPFNTGTDATDTGLLGSGYLGFEDSEIESLGNMLVIHGAEGFGNISGNWRVGAYVGLGSKSVTHVDTATDLQVDLKVGLMTANASIEYVIPLFSNLELAAGSLFGVSRAVIQFSKQEGIPDWAGQFDYSDLDQNNYSVALSGTFFSFQPYVAVKLQFLDRAGLRVSAGYNVGTLPANKWTLNDFVRIQAPSQFDFNALAVRVMLYFGI